MYYQCRNDGRLVEKPKAGNFIYNKMLHFSFCIGTRNLTGHFLIECIILKTNILKYFNDLFYKMDSTSIEIST